MLTLPYQRVSFKSPITPEELVRRFSVVTRQRHWGVWSQADARFVGSVSVDRFRLSYVPVGRNTYAPWLIGKIRPELARLCQIVFFRREGVCAGNREGA